MLGYGSGPSDWTTDLWRRNRGSIPSRTKTYLTFMGPCIANVFLSITNKMQRYTSYLFLWNALHVSGGSSAHHQELKNCQIFSATCHCRGRDFHPLHNSGRISSTTVAGSRNILTKYTMLYIQFLSSWWWAEEPPETCRAFHRNK